MFAKCCWCNYNRKPNNKNKSMKQQQQQNIDSGDDDDDSKTKNCDNDSIHNKTTSNNDEIIDKISNHEIIKVELILDEIKDDNAVLEDEDVFCEGVGPAIQLADNLGTRLNNCELTTMNNNIKSLPKWFDCDLSSAETVLLLSDSDAAPATPPATPVGKDELALRRHRLFSELIDLAQRSTEHRVKFDPFGPVQITSDDNHNAAAAAVDERCCQRFDLEELISRLEHVTLRLEKICLPFQVLIEQEPLISNSSINLSNTSSNKMSVQGFTGIIQGPLAQYLQISKQIGGDVGQHADLVQRAFQQQLQYLIVASQSKQPTNQNDILNLLKPTSDQINAIQTFRESHRMSQLFNHLSAISESIPALGWVAIAPAPAPYVKEMNDAGQFYTNRVLKDWKEKDKKHVDWVKSWIQTLAELQAFVKQYHTTGLVWAGKGQAIVGGGGAPPPPPPGGCPPPPEFSSIDVGAGGDTDRSALFAQINQGENITRSLKKVTSEMQTHKNPTLREGPAPFKTPTHGGNSSFKPIEKPPSFVRDGKKWLIEYQKGNPNLVVENAEMNNVVYLFRCSDSTVTIKGKINSITLDSCKKTSVVFDTLVSAMEFINCQSVQMQVFGKVPTISIDKTDGCQMYLSPDSLNVEIVSSKSSEMNVLVPKGNGDYTEYPVPEQYKTTVVPGKGLSTIVVESKG